MTKDSLSRTTFKKLDTMPDCPFATDTCFCTKHFASKSTLGQAASMMVGVLSAKDEITVEGCPEDAIMTIGSGTSTTAYKVSTIW